MGGSGKFLSHKVEVVEKGEKGRRSFGVSRKLFTLVPERSCSSFSKDLVLNVAPDSAL